MSTQLSLLTSDFEQLWPLAGAESWDTPGLLAGSTSQLVSRVLLTVDVTKEIVDEARDGGFDLILAHHPLILKGVTSLDEATSKGALLASAIRSNIAIYAAHTNADIVQNGVSDTLARAFGLVDLVPLVAGESDSVGHGRLGRLPSSIKLGDFARAISRILPSTASGIRVSGDYDSEISKVALCGGAGDSFIPVVLRSDADVYVTSDLRHHPVQEARETGLNQKPVAFIDVSHWASEWLWLDVAAQQLTSRHPSIQFVVSQIRTDPWDFVVTQ